ncbi:hypothetical protein TRVA0_046S00298 [Trichomonascus vanleenenianus]|uniref:F-box protein n=1 Tax=Trichomonascus vanleenenianus TaxID=2268995 RepID=UPI003ECA5B73
MKGHLLSLPNELLASVAQHLDSASLARFGSTCRRCNEAVAPIRWETLTIMAKQFVIPWDGNLRVCSRHFPDFTRFCLGGEYDADLPIVNKNREYLKYVRRLSIAIDPDELARTTTESVETSKLIMYRSWVDALEWIFPSLNFLNVHIAYTVFPIGDSYMAKKFVAMDVDKVVAINHAGSDLNILPGLPVTRCKKLSINVYSTVNILTLFVHTTVEGTEELELAGSDHSTQPMLPFFSSDTQAFFQFARNLKRLTLTNLQIFGRFMAQADIQSPAAFTWLPESVQVLRLKQCLLSASTAEHPVGTEYSIGYFPKLETFAMEISDTNVSKSSPVTIHRWQMPNLAHLQYSAHPSMFFEDVDHRLEMYRSTAEEFNRSAAHVTKFKPKSADIKIGVLSKDVKHKFETAFLDAVKYITELETLALHMIPGFRYNAEYHSFIESPEAFYDMFEEIINTTLTKLPHVKNLYVIDPKGLETRMVIQGKLTVARDPAFLRRVRALRGENCVGIFKYGNVDESVESLTRMMEHARLAADLAKLPSPPKKNQGIIIGS